MKTSTKITIGLSVAAVASVSVAVMASGKIIEKAKHLATRRKIKRFVDDKFNGNEKLLDMVDRLSDDDLDSIVGILGKIKDGRKKISVYGDNLKDTTEDLKGRLMDFVDGVF
ncbi:hypothetical protein [Enterococcus canis]|nr:hypothetical protein [Enterococcus canis]